MAAALFITFMVCVALVGFVYLGLTFRHYRQLAQSQKNSYKSALVKPPENQ